ncbi:MAG TPA: tetratricopeptide repeat protein, partial [Kofleriaceae bacterium]|nr:tetratricopeptide repeat protein [Kofleriaceae bacterium]
DPYAQQWRDATVAACRATRVAGTQSDSLLDLRMRCLDRRLADLRAGVGEVAAARDADRLEAALEIVLDLPPVDDCADEERVRREFDRPATAQARATADAIEDRLQAIERDRRAERLNGLVARAQAEVDAARRLGHPGMLASALATLARVELLSSEGAGAVDTLRELTQVAARARRDRDEAFAWTQLVEEIGDRGGKPEEGLALVPVANAAVLHAGDPVDERVDLLRHESDVLVAGPRTAEAAAKLDEARKLLVQAGAEQPGSRFAQSLADLVLDDGTLRVRIGDDDGAVKSLQEAAARYRELLGPDSTSEAIALHQLGEALRGAGKPAEARAAFEQAARINGLHPAAAGRLGSNLLSIAAAYGEEHRWDEARAAYDRALPLVRADAHTGPNELAAALLGRAIVDRNAGHPDLARAGYDEAIAVFARAGATGTNLPIARANRGELSLTEGRFEEAAADDRQAITEFEQMDSPTARRLAYPLLGLGHALVELGRPAEAIAPLERGLALDLASRPVIRAQLQSYLARALIGAGRDRARAMQLAREGRAVLAGAAAHGDETAAEALRGHDRWAATHR